MKHFIILLSILTLFSLNGNSQNTSESIGLSTVGSFRGVFFNPEKYNVIRTDEYGNITSVSDMSTTSLDSFDLGEPSFIIYGYTSIKNGKILSRPSDYDYWLVLRYEQFSCRIFPNPTSSNLYVYLNDQTDNSVISIYDIRDRLIGTYSLTDNLTELSISGLQPGYYICKIYNNKTLIKSEKLCII